MGRRAEAGDTRVDESAGDAHARRRTRPEPLERVDAKVGHEQSAVARRRSASRPPSCAGRPDAALPRLSRARRVPLLDAPARAKTRSGPPVGADLITSAATVERIPAAPVQPPTPRARHAERRGGISPSASWRVSRSEGRSGQKDRLRRRSRAAVADSATSARDSARRASRRERPRGASEAGEASALVTRPHPPSIEHVPEHLNAEGCSAKPASETARCSERVCARSRQRWSAGGHRRRGDERYSREDGRDTVCDAGRVVRHLDRELADGRGRDASCPRRGTDQHPGRGVAKMKFQQFAIVKAVRSPVRSEASAAGALSSIAPTSRHESAAAAVPVSACVSAPVPQRVDDRAPGTDDEASARRRLRRSAESATAWVPAAVE